MMPVMSPLLGTGWLVLLGLVALPAAPGQRRSRGGRTTARSIDPEGGSRWKHRPTARVRLNCSLAARVFGRGQPPGTVM